MTSIHAQGIQPSSKLIKQLEKIQTLLSDQATLKDDPRLGEDYDDDLLLPKLVGSISLSATQEEPDLAHLALVVYDTEDNKVIHKVTKAINLGDYKDLKLTHDYINEYFPDQEEELFPLDLDDKINSIPYITNFLAFREVEPYAEIILGLEPHLRPKLIITEGGGRLHPRRCGLATHLGLLIDIPVIGLAKDLLEVGKWNRGQIKEQVADLEDGQSIDLDYEDEIVGKALKPVESSRIVYVSAGNNISIETSLKLIKELSDFRIPEPLRAACLEARQARRLANESSE